ncbi:unnamed protein product [Paramecium sonneborni]|uniref:Uncharacterized protein n=1 Tax=Paramecium sonneborni TaxID=65129 RepID=A0A8S1RUU6_9CILI|nr:unnamed protein product [Paramecium sonneborni]
MSKNKNQKDKQPLTKKKFSYELLENSSLSQSDTCFAISTSFNREKVAVGCYEKIKMFQFKQGGLKLINTLTSHKSHVNAFQFMKKTNTLFSGGDDNIMIIWSTIQINNGKFIKKIFDHKREISCLIANKEQDFIVSGSYDSNIKFWRQKNFWECCQTIKEHRNEINSLSLNQEGNKLISCGQDRFILIMETSQKDNQIQWVLRQKLYENHQGYRLCFIDDSTFVFQPRVGKTMDIYQMNDQQNFKKTKSIAVKGYDQYCNPFFPLQYITSKNLIINKNGYYVNIIKVLENKKFVNCYSINFYFESDGHIYGNLTQDGEYLIIWDSRSSEIQVRKYKEY